MRESIADGDRRKEQKLVALYRRLCGPSSNVTESHTTEVYIYRGLYIPRFIYTEVGKYAFIVCVEVDVKCYRDQNWYHQWHPLKDDLLYVRSPIIPGD